MSSPIELATIDELIAEIESRTESSVVIYQLQEKTGEDCRLKMRHDGGAANAIGMCHVFITHTTKQIDSDPD